MSLPLLCTEPPELLVYDRPSRCPYLTGRVARLPLRLPLTELGPEQLDTRLAAGDRRQGVLLYRTQCPTCQACEPIRLDAGRFEPGRTLRRVYRRAQRDLTITIDRPVVDAQRVELYNRHKYARGLGDGQPPIDADGYGDFLVNSCCDTFEVAYYSGSRLVGVAITDRAANSLSAVYCYYDPDHERYSIGAYSVLKQLELCRRWGKRYLYLGLYIEECEAMAYKARYLPHERLLDGQWVEVASESAARAGRAEL